MAKMSRVSLARKRELEKPDMILSFLQRASLWVGLHRRQAIVAAAAFMAFIIVLTGGSYLSNRAEKKAFNSLTRIMQVNVKSSDAESNKAEEYRLLNKQHGRTTAGKIAGLKYAEICFQSGDYEKAITAYQKALSDLKGNPFFKTMALNGLGYAYESSGNYVQALVSFKRILDSSQAGIKDETLFNLGRLYELSGDMKNSRDMFDRILADYPDSLYAEIVRDGGGNQPDA